MEEISSSESNSQQLEETNVPRVYNNPTRAPRLLLELAMHRYFTFPKDWNEATPKLDLAKSGFFLNSDKETVQCFFCNVKINASANVANVDIKHIELVPTCPLMIGAASCLNVVIRAVTSYSCYRYEANRLFSLLTIKWTAPVNEYDLAKSGFYWIGSADNCRCVFCRLEVRGWEPGDTADGEHRKWSNKCVFLNNRTVHNVPIGSESFPPTQANDVASSVRRSMTYLEFSAAYEASLGNPPQANNVAGSVRRPMTHLEFNSTYGIRQIGARPENQLTLEQLGVIPVKASRRPEYQTYAKRVESYKTWPLSMPQRPEELSEAGFFYTGIGDRVICYQCGGGLKDWSENDLPWDEHAKWYSKCSYVLLKKGPTFVAEVNKTQQMHTLKSKN